MSQVQTMAVLVKKRKSGLKITMKCGEKREKQRPSAITQFSEKPEIDASARVKSSYGSGLSLSE